MKCQSCLTPLLTNARFCHHCGKEAGGDGVVCFDCNTVNPSGARFCSTCGSGINIQYSPNPYISPIYGLNFEDIPTLPSQLTEAFRVLLCLAIAQENAKEKEMLFLHLFQHSDFIQKHLEEATVLMTQEFEEIFDQTGSSAFSGIEQIIERKFTQLLELFFIRYAQDLIPHPLPSAILHYQDTPLEAIHKQRMLIDYLQPDEENLTIYTSAIEIPLPKLKNARKIYFKPTTGETPLLFLDYTLFKSGKEGIVMTAKGIYWKHHFHKNAQVAYHQIKQLAYFDDRLEINGIYLNITPQFNYKLYKLLGRLKNSIG
jgi:hypothetical protein